MLYWMPSLPAMTLVSPRSQRDSDALLTGPCGSVCSTGMRKFVAVRATITRPNGHGGFQCIPGRTSRPTALPRTYATALSSDSTL